MSDRRKPDLDEFVAVVTGYFETHRRDLPWRRPEPDGSYDAYKIMVSEIMLQQTQVSRVIPKYDEFLDVFPNVLSLAEANLGDVLKLWSGLGYNRRAKYLHSAAKQIVKRHNGTIPETLNTLTCLPGIGYNTAAAICVYAYDQPQIFIETNIRTVYIHHFFKHAHDVADKDIRPLVASTLHGQDPREFYWALMDYGTYIKSTEGNVNVKSKHYIKQSTFHGSRRQIRGQILKLLMDGPKKRSELLEKISDVRTEDVLHELENEQLIIRTKSSYTLGS